MADSYCCAMRRHFVIGLAGTRADEPTPFEIMEFMPDITTRLIVIKFCPFCGVELDNTQPFRVTGNSDGNNTPA